MIESRFFLRNSPSLFLSLRMAVTARDDDLAPFDESPLFGAF
jgi:hypothetical protein